MLATVGGAIDAAFLLRAGGAAKRAHEGDVGIHGMNEDSSDAARVIEADVRPVLPGIGGDVNPVAHHVAVANRPSFAGAYPDHAWVRRRYGDGADGCHRLLVEDRLPAIAGVGGFPDAAGRGTCVVRARVAGDTGDRSDPVACARPEKAKTKRVFVGARAGRSLRVGNGHASCQDRKE